MSAWKLRVALAVAITAPCTVAASAGAKPPRWSKPRQIAHRPAFSNVAPSAVSCPSASRCYMTDSGGDIAVLSNPGAPNAARTVTTLPQVNSLEGIDCPAPTLCIAFDADNNVITSTDPAGGPGAWKLANLTSALGSLSCPSTALCVGVDSDGSLLVSTEPTGGRSAWTKTTLPSLLSGVSCPFATFCVALDKTGHVLVATNPTGGAGAWTLSGATLPTNAAFSCTPTSLCVAWVPSNRNGTVYTTTTPATSTPWTSAAIDGSQPIYTVDCPTVALCVAGDTAGNVITSTNPTGGPGAWRVANVDGTAYIYSISCPTTSLCVGADGEYEALTSTSPTGGRAGWRVVKFPGYDAFTSLSCPATNSCVAVDGFGDHFVTSSHPARTWKLSTIRHGIGENPEIYRVACASRSVCLALVTDMGPPGASGADGTIYSFNPVGRPHGFHRITIHGADTSLGLIEVTCVHGPVCAAVDYGGRVFTSSDPARSRSWHRDRSGRRWFASSCPAPGFCVALGADPGLPSGNGDSPPFFVVPAGVIAVLTPGAARTASIDGTNGLTGISCPSKSLCVASDNAGNVLTSTRPADGARAWHSTHVDNWALTAISCPSQRLCIAVDEDGRVVVGRS